MSKRDLRAKLDNASVAYAVDCLVRYGQQRGIPLMGDSCMRAFLDRAVRDRMVDGKSRFEAEREIQARLDEAIAPQGKRRA